MPEYTSYGLPTPAGALSTFLAAAAQSTSIPEGIATLGQSNISTADVGTDPYLDVLPAFAYSLPVQLVVMSTIVTLLSILTIHLLFSIRYHYPLSKFNYLAQCSAVLTSLVTNSVVMGILSVALIAKTQEWPYMFDYIEIAIPAPNWSTANTSAWLFSQAAATLSLHITHIQFLTLLFPSTLEFRLIIILLGPLALASSLLEFTFLSENPAIVDLGDAVRNVASSTLTLLYSCALLIWGLTLNRKRAWRTDGGTAAFGILAIFLGIFGTTVNFVELREERLRWLSGVVNTVLLWQSWVSFWWWVGSGMYEGEAADIEKKNAKRNRRLEAKRLKKINSTSSSRTAGISSNLTPNLTTLYRRFTTTKPKTETPPPSIELQQFSGRNAMSSPSQTLSTASNASTPIPSTWLASIIYPLIKKLVKAHDDEALERNKKSSALETKRGGIRALVAKGRRERGARRVSEGMGNLTIGDLRAGFQDDGIQPLGEEGNEDEGWEDEVPAITAEWQSRIWKWRTTWRQKEVNKW